MTHLAPEVLRWMQSETAPLSLASLSKVLGPEKLLCLYGMHNEQLVITHLDPNQGTEFYKIQTDQRLRIKEIMTRHLAYLANKSGPQSPLRLPQGSVFEGRLYTAYPSLPCLMTQHLREDFPLRKNAICEARFFALQHLPPQENEEITVGSVINELEEAYVQAVKRMYAWFDATTPASELLMLDSDKWLKMQVLLIRYGFCDTMSAWVDEQVRRHGQGSCQVQLYATWRRLFTLYELLKLNPARPPGERIQFYRPADLALSTDDSLKAYVRRSNLQLVQTALSGCGIEFDLSFLSRYLRAEFNDIRLSNYTLYFIDAVSKKYMVLQTTKMDEQELLRGCVRGLQNLFFSDDYQLPRERERLYCVLLGILFYVHSKTTMSSFTALMKVCEVQFQVAPTLTNLDLDLRYVRTHCPERERDFVSILRILEAFGRKAPGLSIKEHIEFLVAFEEHTRLFWPSSQIALILTTLPLVEQNSAIDLRQSAMINLRDFRAVRQELIRLKDDVHLPDSLIEALQTWQGNCAQVFPMTPEYAEIIPKVIELFRYSLCPPERLVYHYTQFLHMMLPKPDTSDEQYGAWEKVRQHNGALIELTPGSRAICCRGFWAEDRRSFHMSVLWIDSLATLQTRGFEVTLPIAEDCLPSSIKYAYDAEALCVEERMVEVDGVIPEFRGFCYVLKRKMRALLLGCEPPMLTFDATRGCFYIQKPDAELPDAAFQVELRECEPILSGGGQNCCVSTAVFTPSGVSLQEITVCWTHTGQASQISDEHTDCFIGTEFYTVMLSFANAKWQNIKYEMCYLARPTVQLLAWQLALLKERFYKASFSFFSETSSLPTGPK